MNQRTVALLGGVLSVFKERAAEMIKYFYASAKENKMYKLNTVWLETLHLKGGISIIKNLLSNKKFLCEKDSSFCNAIVLTIT